MNPALLALLGARVATGGGGTLTATYLGNYSTATDASSYTATAADLGAESADRTIIVALSFTGQPDVSSVTIGGNAATVDVVVDSAGTSFPGVAVARLSVPSGTNADIVASFTGTGLVARCTIGWFAITGGTPSPANTPTGVDTLAVTVPAGGVAIVAGEFGIVGTWSGFTPDYTSGQDSTWRGVGGRLTASATVTNTGATLPRLAAVAYTSA